MVPTGKSLTPNGAGRRTRVAPWPWPQRRAGEILLWAALLTLLATAAAVLAAGCGGGGGGTPTSPRPNPTPAPSVAIVELIDNSFSPRSVTIQPGDTVRWIYRSGPTDHTTTAASGAWDSGFVFRSAGDAFERTFPASEAGLTFEYYCRTHQACCQMQGSVRVGANAPPPGPGY